MIPSIKIADYNYSLPEDRIAKFPLEKRDSSKLLVFRNGEINDMVFRDIASVVPSDSMMVFNETKVVPARLHFCRESGANIEIFCLEPYSPSAYEEIFSSKGKCRWKCIVGNVKRWKESESLKIINSSSSSRVEDLQLCASLLEKNGNTSIVEFSWNPEYDFSSVLNICGTMPIPPYLKREAQEIDLERYQTTYALQKGSVAAPTAGLHFTEETVRQLEGKGIDIQKVCLHVGAGTFLPVKSAEIGGHTMHREPFVVTLEFLECLAAHKRAGKPLVAVGTTSVRTLESLYWTGLKCLRGEELCDIGQWEPYEDRVHEESAADAIEALCRHMREQGMKELKLATRIIIVPGYRIRIVDALVTNFHQPQSTLLLLISAFIGRQWRSVYSHALSSGYRFLSYGDSSILFTVNELA